MSDLPTPAEARDALLGEDSDHLLAGTAADRARWSLINRRQVEASVETLRRAGRILYRHEIDYRALEWAAYLARALVINLPKESDLTFDDCRRLMRPGGDRRSAEAIAERAELDAAIWTTLLDHEDAVSDLARILCPAERTVAQQRRAILDAYARHFDRIR